MSSTARLRVRIVLGLILAMAVTVGFSPVASAGSHPRDRVTVVNYDFASLAQYNQKWSNIYGPLDGATQSVSKGALTVSDVPFKPGTDFSVYDHLKYMAVSNQVFPAPPDGSVSFSVDIKASTPGAVAGHVVHGSFGPPGSFGTPTAGKPYASPVLEAQQAAVVLNMIDFCSGQLFDWFVSSHSAFPLIERLPSTITGNTTNPACTDAETADLSKAYTQIIKVVRIAAGSTHRYGISLSQGRSGADVAYLMDDHVVAIVHNVGIPLDKQHVRYTGLYPSLGKGEQLNGRIQSVQIGHGLFSLLDAFPFQYGCTPASATGPGMCDPATAKYSVSIPAAQRSFGQGAVGTFGHFQVVTETSGRVR